MGKNKKNQTNELSIVEASAWQADLEFFATELAAVISEMQKGNVDALEIDSYLTIRDGIRRINPGLSRIRYSALRALKEIAGNEKQKIVDPEIIKVAETLERFKRLKKDG